MPTVGTGELHILSPALLELSFVNTAEPDSTPRDWNFVSGESELKLPDVSRFEVLANGNKIAVQGLGYKRRPLYAPLKKHDLRIGNYIYLQLAAPIPDGAFVVVRNPANDLWQNQKRYQAFADPLRWSPVIHVNQEGYAPQFAKRAMVGYYLGNLGEMDITTNGGFKIVQAGTGKIMFEGNLVPRKDMGYEPPAYQGVLEADFSQFKTPGEYQVQVPGLGASFPFFIDEGIPANFTRAYALGLYHQRCGAVNYLPHTRYMHKACHTAPAEVPTASLTVLNEVLKGETGNFSSNPRHTAPQLQNVDASIHPFVRKTKLDVSGGHHDAGDYSKYTINSAQLIHSLVFAADMFPGVGALDNLGLPESGDGKSDILQEAKWEADFVAKMQDEDGGFYFLVYPRERRYEHDVLPHKGDPQVVFPKTTSATAAAVAALAQTASSPLFKKQFPEAAADYLAKAKKGWEFLEKAIETHGRDGAYQKITHYGDEFMHDDELAWAATELFLATGEEKFQQDLIKHFNPNDRETRRWTWWRLFESYGCAIRSYAFAEKSGRLRAAKLNSEFLKACEAEIIAGAEDQLRDSSQNAYGTSFPYESKRFRNAGWYFSSDRAFDLAVGCLIDFPELRDPEPKFIDAILANLNYEAGCNPVNVSFVSGLGWKRPREMVHHVAQNDRSALPPSGLTWGNIAEGFMYVDPYRKQLGELTFPRDGDKEKPYPFYDRWGDSFNTSQEFVVPNLGRALATSAFLMARTSLTNQVWRGTSAHVVNLSATGTNANVTASLKAEGLNLQKSRAIWEVENEEPVIVANGNSFPLPNLRGSSRWLEVELHLPDGRRVFAVTNSPAGIK